MTITPERLAEIRDLSVDSCSADAPHNPDVWALESARKDLLAEVDRLNAAVNLLGGQLQGGAQAARDLGRVIDLTALEIRRAVRLANAGDPAAAMRVITEWASEAAWLDDLDAGDDDCHAGGTR